MRNIVDTTATLVIFERLAATFYRLRSLQKVIHIAWQNQPLHRRHVDAVT